MKNCSKNLMVYYIKIGLLLHKLDKNDGEKIKVLLLKKMGLLSKVDEKVWPKMGVLLHKTDKKVRLKNSGHAPSHL